MQLNEPYLIIDLDDNKIVFFVITYNQNKDYKIIKKIIIDSVGIQNGRTIDVDLVTQLIKKTINSIEDEINHFLLHATVVINPNNVNCLNVSGYKRLNGSQISKEDITYILNDIKKIILTNEDKYSLIHLFNSSFSLDSDNLENLPIGLFGEFYNQNMTFFLANKNILKNIKLVFNNCGINIERIILKPFVEGISFLSKNKLKKNFTTIKLEKKRISISLFKNKSYVFSQDFDFGIDLIIKDISKLCSLKIEEVQILLHEINFKDVLENNDESYLDKKYFSISSYRKIKLQLILDIISARVDELFEICYEKNSNLNYFKKNNNFIYIVIEKPEYLKNIQFVLENKKLSNLELNFNENFEETLIFASKGAAELIGKGWEKEAIPFIQSKKSVISNFFSRLFS